MNTSQLINQKSDPKVSLATPQQIQSWLEQIPAWEIKSDTLHRQFDFQNFYQTIAFVNAIAWIANAEDHHPDLQVSYKTVTVTYATHTVKGLSENDFICAAKIDHLYTL